MTTPMRGMTSLLRAVPQFLEVEVVEGGDRLERVGEVPTATSVVTKHAPILASSDGVLDARSTSTVPAPRAVTPNPVAAEHGRL
jgi:hypothetical protein